MAIESSAGRSAQRQYELRRAQEQARRKQQWGPVGSLVAALAPQSQSTRAWAIGAEGERRLGARLDAISGDHIAVVHDRRIPYSQTNIDHLVVTAQGVWVIDAKRYKGRPERRTEGGMARPREEKLYVDRRDRSHLVEGVQYQVDVVKKALRHSAVQGALCFIDADWAFLETAFTVRGVRVCSPRQLTSQLRKQNSGAVDVQRAAAFLADYFGPA